MRLATFLHDGVERWGFVVRDPETGEECLVDPGLAEAELASSAIGTSGYAASRPHFLGDTWPTTLVDFLRLGDEAMLALSRLEAFLARFVAQSDATILHRAAHALRDITLLAPIPRPRLCWGLVTNAPSFVRNNLGVEHLNLFPLGHQRSQGSVIAAGEPIPMKNGHHLPLMSYNVELGIVIGKGGRYIPLENAMEHVAGFTTINDVAGTYYYGIVPGNEGQGYRLPAPYDDWFYQATASWGGKIADGMCPMGPYLVTRDEVGDPYDLLVYTRQDGRTRNRAHTSATLLGIERVINWYSSFASLHPGDVIHFGTMGIDGLPVPGTVLERGGTVLEAEVEDVGLLRNPVHVIAPGETIRFDEHPSYAVRQAAAEEPLLGDRDEWSGERARHFYTAFGNHARAEPHEGLATLAIPRFFTGPASSLGVSGSRIDLPPRATDLLLSIELAVVVGRLSSDVDAADAERIILGVTPLISVCDLSFQQAVVEPARLGERHIPAVYGRWADGFNVVLQRPVAWPADWRGLRMTLDVDGEHVTGSTSDYVAGPGELIETISAMTTLFPGDVITLGSTSARIRVPSGASVRAVGRIEGFGQVFAELAPAPNARS